MQFFDLIAQDEPVRENIELGINSVLKHGQFIMGPEVSELESKLCEYTKSKHCITCANGTDALQLALLAAGVGKGDIVFTTAFSFFATAEAIASVQATPYFVDIDETQLNLSSISLVAAIEDSKAKQLGNPKAIISVDIFGLPANYPELQEVCQAYDLLLIADGAQSFGSEIRNVKTTAMATVATTSFFPAKPLGCYGDGGAVFTNDDHIATMLRSLRVHGKGKNKYHNVRIGMNSRLDTLQAAVLLEKLPILEHQILTRDNIIQRYKEALADNYEFQVAPTGYKSAHAQCSLRNKTVPREVVLDALERANIPYQIYYPQPLNATAPMKNFPSDGCTVATDVCTKIFSIPCHVSLQDADVEKIIRVLSEVNDNN